MSSAPRAVLSRATINQQNIALLQHSSEREKDKEKRLTVDIGLANQLAQIRLAGNIEGVIRSKSKGKGSETAAREVSDSLPFLEYELHSQLLNKLKLSCAQVQVATAEETRDLAELQARITDVVQQHRDRLNTEIAEETGLDHSPHGAHTDDSDEEQSDLEVSFLGKDTFILEVDDPKDEIISLILKDCRPPAGFEMFTQMAEVRYLPQINTKVEFADIFDMLLRRMCFKLRRLAPCCLTDLNFTMEIPDEDEVQCQTVSQTYRHNTREQEEKKKPATNPKPHVGVELTPLPTVIGGKIIKYLGNYNFFLIRESTSVKEVCD
nr:hypothetical protein BaRGS_028535 [Batillaria attramentaria]